MFAMTFNLSQKLSNPLMVCPRHYFSNRLHSLALNLHTFHPSNLLNNPAIAPTLLAAKWSLHLNNALNNLVIAPMNQVGTRSTRYYYS